MQSERLRESLEQLRSEINSAIPPEGPSRERLNRLINDIERKLASPDDAEHHENLLSNVQDSIHHLELAHPRATSILNQIMETLAGGGI